MYKKACTPYSWHHDAFNLAEKKKITLFSTPFSLKAAKFLNSYDVNLFKIASLEITDVKLIDLIASFKKPIILSTGACRLSDVKLAINTIRKYHNKIIILHCVSGYPTKIENANINRIKYLKENFKNNMIGLSDHTDNVFSSLASVPLGVVAIEKHLKISKNSRTLDSAFSITPDQLSNLKTFSVNIFKSLGKLQKENKVDKNMRIMRRSIFALKDIKKNEKLTEENIYTLRPKIGVCASKYFKVINKRIKKNLKRNKPIFKNDLF